MSDTNNEAISNVIQENIDTKDYIADAYSEAFRKDETSFPADGLLNSENLPDTILRIKTFKDGLDGEDGPRIFAVRGLLEENDSSNNLDNITNNNGIYFLEEGKEYDNIPSEAKNTNQKLKDNAILKIIVNDSETQIRQELFVGEQVFVRKGFKNTNDINIEWSTWEEITPLRIKNTNFSTRDNATDPNTIYNYNNGEGYIITSTAGNKQTQYYFANDGGFRYRCRKRDDVNDNWGNWPNEFKHISSDNIINFESISNLTVLNDRITPLDTQTIYRFNNGQGFIFSSVVSNKETQYYFAEDGILRYRTRNLVNGKGERWTRQFTTYPTNETVMRYAESSSMDNYTEQTIYKYPSHGLIIPVTTSDKQAQYYLPEDGVLRYRYKTTNGNWVNGGKFLVMVNEENINKYLSPQNRADKYFLRTCIDKTKIKLNKNTQILAFGDSITAGNTHNENSWLKFLVEKIGCPTPYNLAVSGASFGVNNWSLNSELIMSTQLDTLDSKVLSGEIDLSAVDLIIVAAGTNDAFNNTPINGTDTTAFAQAISSFISALKAKFSTDCPPILFITPIRRGSKTDIDASGENNVEIKLAKYGAVICNIALLEGCSVINGFDIPITTDTITISDVNNNEATLQSFMAESDSRQHLHPNDEGLKIYAQSIIGIIGESIIIDSELSNTSECPVQNKVIQQTLNTKENISNKAISLDNPSDETYPTTQAVSEALDTKADKINSFMFKELPKFKKLDPESELELEYFDLNEVTEEGYYLLVSSSSSLEYQNSPQSNITGVLEVFKSFYDIKNNQPRYIIFQRIITEGKKIYLRHSTIAQKFDDSSHNWKCINLEDSSNKVTSFDELSNETYPTTQAVSNALDTKVNKEDGKDLSTNDFTDEDRGQLNKTVKQYNIANKRIAASGYSLPAANYSLLYSNILLLPQYNKITVYPKNIEGAAVQYCILRNKDYSEDSFIVKNTIQDLSAPIVIEYEEYKNQNDSLYLIIMIKYTDINKVFDLEENKDSLTFMFNGTMKDTLDTKADSSEVSEILSTKENSSNKDYYQEGDYAGISDDDTRYPSSLAVRNALDKLASNMEVEQNIYNNTYNITSNPTITTDTNNFLASTGSDSDCSNAIRSMLNQTGCCILGPGDFYISDLVMPDNTCLRGCGNKTRLIWSRANGSTCMIQMGHNCNIENLMIDAEGSTYNPFSWGEEETPIDEKDIEGLFSAILYQNHEAVGIQDLNQSKISNVSIFNCKGIGIKTTSSTSKVDRNLIVINCHVRDCICGIYNEAYSKKENVYNEEKQEYEEQTILITSEFHKFTNVVITHSFYGCVVQGGNIIYNNCTFGTCHIAIKLDSGPNNSHGIFNACLFVHCADNTGNNTKSSNAGYALKANNITNGELFNGCNFGFGKIEIQNCAGIKFMACGIGKSQISIDESSEGTIFNGSTLGSTVNYTNNSTATRIINCFTREGEEWQP